MPDTFSALTIAALFMRLAQVERAIRDSDPLFVQDGDQDALNPRLIDLAAEEQAICDELARRRAGLQAEMQARLLSLQRTSH